MSIGPRTLAERAPLMFLVTLVTGFALSANGWGATRTLEFKTTEVTDASLSVFPDGESMVFGLLGHLFRMPVTGGAATQLTFGPYYDSRPVVSPDGRRIAFVSSRDGSDGNIFVMELASGRISQLTSVYQAGAPAWSPDGETIAFLSYARREEYPVGQTPGFGASTILGTLMTVAAGGGAPETLSAPRAFGAVFYLADGRLAWTIEERPPGGGRGPGQGVPVSMTRLEARSDEGAISGIGSLPGALGPLVLTPDRSGFYYTGGEQLRQYFLESGRSEVVAPFAGGVTALDVARDLSTLYAAAGAKLWRIDVAGSDVRQIPFVADVRMETLVPAVPDWAPPGGPNVDLRAVLTPRISPDGETMVFMAAGFLWEQPTNGGEAQRLLDERAYQLAPAFSPDGDELVFIADDFGQREVRVFDFATRQARTVATVPGASWALYPSWSRDGRHIVFQRTDGISAPYRLLRVDATRGGEPEELARTAGSWTARPHLSSDGTALYYTGRSDLIANFYRLPLHEGAEPEAVTELTRHVHDARLSPDESWLAFRRNTEIWVAPMADDVLKDEDFRKFSDVGGRSFAFTADSSAIVYSEGDRVWRKSLRGARAAEIPVRLTLPRATAAPLLIENARVLDLIADTFTGPTSMLIEGGRISWIGPAAGRTLPASVVRIDAGGRFAIPGIMDTHTHAAWSNQKITDDSLIAYGVTSVRDTGSRLDEVNALLDRGEATDLAVPRYFHSGDIFEGLMPLWGDAFLEITTATEAREYVRRWKDLGAHFIKVYASLPWHLKTVAAEEANRLGMPVAGHGLSIEEIVRSVNLGFASLEHNGPNRNDDMVKLFAASGTRLEPTLTVFGQGTPFMLGNPETLNERFRTFIPEDAISAAPGRGVSESQLETWRAGTLVPVGEQYYRGVKFLSGTDALMTNVFHGPSVHWSMQFFGWAGVPAIDVLRMATLQSAEVVGAAEDLGSLEAGKIADVVLLDQDPLEDLANTMSIWRVIKEGRLFDPDQMRPEM